MKCTTPASPARLPFATRTSCDFPQSGHALRITPSPSSNASTPNESQMQFPYQWIPPDSTSNPVGTHENGGAIQMSRVPGLRTIARPTASRSNDPPVACCANPSLLATESTVGTAPPSTSCLKISSRTLRSRSAGSWSWGYQPAGPFDNAVSNDGNFCIANSDGFWDLEGALAAIMYSSTLRSTGSWPPLASLV